MPVAARGGSRRGATAATYALTPYSAYDAAVGKPSVRPAAAHGRLLHMRRRLLPAPLSLRRGETSHKLDDIIVIRLTAAERFIKVVLRYGITQMIERELHAAIVNGMPQIVHDIQRHIATGTD